MTSPYAKMPKTVLKSHISSDAKIVYLCLLDRFSLSAKNGWQDNDGRTFIIFPLSEVMELLNCSKSKASRVLSELGGLIEKRRRGLGKPDVIYINIDCLNESAETSSAEIFDCDIVDETTKEKPTELKKEPYENSRGNIYETQEVLNLDPNNNNINKNKLNKNNFNKSSYHIYQCNWIEDRIECVKKIKENIEYDYLITSHNKKIIDEIITVMTNAVCSNKEKLSIGGEEIPIEFVKTKLLSLDSGHIEYVCECLQKKRTGIKNMSAYVLSCLYHATDVINLYYLNMVNCDMV